MIILQILRYTNSTAEIIDRKISIKKKKYLLQKQHDIL